MIMLNKYDSFVGLCDCCTSPHKEPKKKYLYNLQLDNKIFYVCCDCLRELQQQLNKENEFIKTGKIEEVEKNEI